LSTRADNHWLSSLVNDLISSPDTPLTPEFNYEAVSSPDTPPTPEFNYEAVSEVLNEFESVHPEIFEDLKLP